MKEEDAKEEEIVKGGRRRTGILESHAKRQSQREVNCSPTAAEARINRERRELDLHST